MTRPRLGLYYIEDVGQVHLPELTIYETELMEPIGFLHGTVLVQVPDKPKKARTKPKAKTRAKTRAKPKPKRRTR